MKKYLTLILFLWSIFAFAALEIVEKSENSYLYQYQVDEYQLQENQSFTILQLGDQLLSGEAGAPQLPQHSLNFIVPENGQISVRIIDYQTKNISLNKPIIPNPTMLPQQDTFRESYIIDAEAYNRSYEILQQAELASYRQYDFYPVQFSPFIYDHANLNLQVVTEIKFQIEVQAARYSGDTFEDNFQGVYEEMFQNYSTARHYGIRRETASQALDFSASDFWYKITVDGTGVFYLEEELDDLPRFASYQQLALVKSREQQGKFSWQQLPIDFSEAETAAPARLYFQNSGSGNTVWLYISAADAVAPRADLEQDFAQTATTFRRKQFSNPSRQNYHSIIIYPQDNTFASEAETLADFYQRNFGLESLLISQEDIFDRYTGGNETQTSGQQAVKDTLEACYESYTNLQYVTLLGSGSSNWSSDHAKNKIITYSFGNYVSDDGFVNFHYDTGSYVPELAVGRFPAQNENQLNEMLQRLEQFVEAGEPGLWRDRVMLVADDENKSGGYEGLTTTNFGMNHSRVIEYLDGFIDQRVIVDKVFAFNYDFNEFQNKPGVRDKQVEILNDGCAVWLYVGHGNPIKIGDENYFEVSDLQYLDNVPRLPIFIAASCSVGKYDDLNVDSLSEQMLYSYFGGAIATIAATNATGPDFNADLMQILLPNLINSTLPAGMALVQAKATYANGSRFGRSSSLRYYNILGSPVISAPIPPAGGEFANIDQVLQARETFAISGEVGSDLSSGTGILMVHDTEQDLNYSNLNFHNAEDPEDEDYLYYSVDYTKPGNIFYQGTTSINNGQFSTEAIVPDDIRDGDKGKMLLYYHDEFSGEDYVNVLTDISYSSAALDIEDNNPPQVTLMLDSDSFQRGDYVSTAPLLLADIEDEHGINTLGRPGHSMLVLVDGGAPIDVSSGFIYEQDSSRRGRLSWQLQELEEGTHHLQLIVFDNFNNYTLAETEFRSKAAGKIFISDLLFYPNPHDYTEEAKFTFVVTEAAEASLTIYTITGRKIAALPTQYCSSGYNEIAWTGRDNDGDKLANGTYFYKLRVKSETDGKLSEKIGKLIILK
ncbi:MAG: C25 family cysteine peptidase [Candidatus Cloacimonadales bacterium]